MNDITPNKDRKVTSLRAALRVARVEEAERSEAVTQMRGVELARLEMLRDEIEPVLAQIPDGVDMFDTGLMPGPQPRLFIDMIAFVEMGHDKRLYRFVQDSRHGRVTLAESDRLDVMSDAIAAYIARRLIQREKALASDQAADHAMSPPVAETSSGTARPAANDWAPPRPSRGSGFGARVGRMIVDYMGIAALCVLVWFLWRYGASYWTVLTH